VTLWLVRHAQPLVEPGLCYGSLDLDVDAQATQNSARELAEVLPQRLAVRTSPLQRCKLLADSLQGLRPDLTVDVDARLAELNFGCHEGQRWDEIDPRAMQAWTDNFWYGRFGGAQSVSELMQRVAAAWDDAVSQGQQVVWITHAGVICAASLLTRGVRRVDNAADWPTTPVRFGQWLRLPLQPVADLP